MARRQDAVQYGVDAEAYVAQALVQHGWRVLGRRVRLAGAELDLVIQRDAALRFVEVKARSGEDPARVLETIGHRKRSRLRRAASAWLDRHPTTADDIAFLIAVVDRQAEPWSIHWLDDAFDGS